MKYALNNKITKMLQRNNICNLFCNNADCALFNPCSGYVGGRETDD